MRCPTPLPSRRHSGRRRRSSSVARPSSTRFTRILSFSSALGCTSGWLSSSRKRAPMGTVQSWPDGRAASGSQHAMARKRHLSVPAGKRARPAGKQTRPAGKQTRRAVKPAASSKHASPSAPLEVVVLAAGEGKRMKSDLPKVLQPLAGRPLLKHVIDTAQSLKPAEIHVVYGHGGQRVREALSDYPVSWVLQAEQLGTGHALQQALPRVAND